MKKRLRGLLGIILILCLWIQPAAAYAAPDQDVVGQVGGGTVRGITLNEVYHRIEIYPDSSVGGAYNVTNADEIGAYTNYEGLTYDIYGVKSETDQEMTGNSYTKSTLSFTYLPQGYKGVMLTNAVAADDYYLDGELGTYVQPTLLTFAFDPITYTAVFQGNEGMTSDNKSEVTIPCTYGVNADLPSFSKSNYMLTGFEPVGGGTSIGGSGTFKNLTDIDQATVTYQAVWSEIPGYLYVRDSGFSGVTGTIYPTGTKICCDPDGYFRISLDGIDKTNDISGETASNGAVTCKNGTYTLPALSAQDIGYNISAVQTAVPVQSASGTEGNYWNIEITTVKKGYHLAFDANGGSGSMESLEKTAGTDFTLPANSFTRENYTFSGWSTDGSSLISFADEDSLNYTPQNDGDTLTLYAVWSEVAGNLYVKNSGFNYNAAAIYDAGQKICSDLDGYYTVSLDGEDKTADISGVTASDAEGTVTCKNGTYTLPAISDQDLGYKISAVKTGTQVSAEGKRAGACWNIEITTVKKGYRLTFDANGGSGSMENLETTAGTDFTLPANSFTRENYTFLGWSTDGSNLISYADEGSLNYTPQNDGDTLTLYAVWSETTGNLYVKNSGFDFDSTGIYGPGVKICSDLDGYFAVSLDGTDKTNDISGVTASDTDGTVTCKNGTYTLPALSQQAVGYKIAAVQTETEVSAEGKRTGAYWNIEITTAKKNYTLVFDANGGSGSMENLEKTAGTDFVLPANAFTRENYTFAGWSTDGSDTVSYADGDRLVYTPQNSGDVLTLYAVWTPIPLSGPSGVTEGTVHLEAGTAYSYDGVTGFHVTGDATLYPAGVAFYVSSSGDYTITPAN